MSSETRTFAIASDEALVGLIAAARTRLIVIAPALTKPVADALARRLDDLDHLGVTIILDSDPEVYRLGFGDQDALEVIRTASAKNMFDLREQPGVRIGVIVADGTTLIYSPISKNIEAGPTSGDRPNAIVLHGGVAGCIAASVGGNNSGGHNSDGTAEVGNVALDPTKVREMQENLNANPPKPFDMTRKLNVFSSMVQYVEFSASNYRLTTRQIPLPSELVAVDDDDLKKRITGRIRAPIDDIGKLKITIDQKGHLEALEVDDDWLNKERKRIEDDYTFPVNNFGRVILYFHRQIFDDRAERFRLIIKEYQKALSSKLLDLKENFETRIIDEYYERWLQSPPFQYFAKYSIRATPDNIRTALKRTASDLFSSAVAFEQPVVKVLYKNVSPENIRDPAFLDALEASMHKRKVPPEIVNSLFESGQVAPETGKFAGR